MGTFLFMKTTLELPDSLFRRAKATAARRGQTMATFVTSAVEAKLAADEVAAREKPWMEFAGILQDERAESQRILQKVEDACEKVDSEDWR
jgi:predicted nucleotide-binding protein